MKQLTGIRNDPWFQYFNARKRCERAERKACRAAWTTFCDTARAQGLTFRNTEGVCDAVFTRTEKPYRAFSGYLSRAMQTV